SPPILFALGVGHNKDPVPSVRGTDGSSRNNKRPCLVACVFQVRKHIVEAQTDVSSNIFSKYPSGPEFPHESKHFRPEIAVILRASSLPGNTERLAGVSSANKVNCSPIANHPVFLQSLPRQLPYIRVNWHGWPMLFQHLLAVRFNFTKSDCLNPGPLCGQGHAADTGKQVKHPHSVPLPCYAILVYCVIFDTAQPFRTTHRRNGHTT